MTDRELRYRMYVQAPGRTTCFLAASDTELDLMARVQGALAEGVRVTIFDNGSNPREYVVEALPRAPWWRRWLRT